MIKCVVMKNVYHKVVDAGDRGFSLGVREALRYRYLMLLFVKRDFSAIYKQSILGPVWIVLQPLLTSTVFTIVFGLLTGLPTDGAPSFLFYFAGLVPWTYFSQVVTKTSNTFIEFQPIFSKVYFPRLVVPLANVLSNGIVFLVQFVAFLITYGICLFSGMTPHITWWMLLLPLLILQTVMLGLGVGLLVSSMTIKYRDLKHVLTFAIQLWMYVTPIIYSIETIPEKFRWVVYYCNPMTSITVNFKLLFFGGSFNLPAQIVSALLTCLILYLGIYLFAKAERDFVDTI